MTASGAKASKKEEVANVFCFVYVGKKEERDRRKKRKAVEQRHHTHQGKYDSHNRRQPTSKKKEINKKRSKMIQFRFRI